MSDDRLSPGANAFFDRLAEHDHITNSKALAAALDAFDSACLRHTRASQTEPERYTCANTGTSVAWTGYGRNDRLRALAAAIRAYEDATPAAQQVEQPFAWYRPRHGTDADQEPEFRTTTPPEGHGWLPVPGAVIPAGMVLMPLEPNFEMIDVLARRDFTQDWSLGKQLQWEQVRRKPRGWTIPYKTEYETAAGHYMRMVMTIHPLAYGPKE